MSETLTWWLMAQVVGLAALPLCLSLFRSLPDRGYALSKPFALILLGYVFWILVVLGLPNSTRSIVFVLALLVAASGAMLWTRREELLDFVRRRWWLIASTEVVFFLVFITAAYLRAFVPDVAGTEKPMDFMYLNAMTAADGFPPEDPWMAGENVAYYYFGYLLISIMTRLSGLATSIGYNLGLAFTVALAATAAFGIVYNLVAPRERQAAAGGPGTPEAGFDAKVLWRPMIFGVVAALLLTVMANLEGLLEWISTQPIAPDGFWSWVGISDGGASLANYTSSQWYPDRHLFWWLSTRIIQVSPGLYGIHEFPFFSFLLGDLHPHVMSIPFVLLALGGALALLRHDGPLDLVVWLERPLWLVAFAIMLGGLAFLNTWDMPTMAAVITLVALLRNRLHADRWSWGLAVDTAGFVAPLLLASFLAYVPFFFGGFDSQASGFKADAFHGTRLLHAFLIWGPFAIIVLPYAFWRLRRGGPVSSRAIALALAPAALIVVAWLSWDLLASATGWLLPERFEFNDVDAGFWTRIEDRGWNWLTVVVLGSALGLLLMALVRETDAASDERSDAGLGHVFALGLSAVAALLILGSELFFIQDFFNARMNTVFKLYYQSWLLLSIAGGFVLYELTRDFRWPPSLPQREASSTPANLPLGEIAVVVAAMAGAITGLIIGGEALLRLTLAVVGAGIAAVATGVVVLAWRSFEGKAGDGLLTWRGVWATATGVVLLSAFVYAPLATWNQTGGCAGHPLRLLEGTQNCGDIYARRSLDSLRTYKEGNLPEYAATQWIEDLEVRPVVAQAVGQGYRWETSRVSAITGLPTILGWQGHEEQWRGGNAETTPRAEDLSTLYTSSDPGAVATVLQRYGVTHILVGPAERSQYPDLQITNLTELVGQAPAFAQGDVAIYRVQPAILSEVVRE